jgi:ribonuclease III
MKTYYGCLDFTDKIKNQYCWSLNTINDNDYYKEKVYSNEISNEFKSYSLIHSDLFNKHLVPDLSIYLKDVSSILNIKTSTKDDEYYDNIIIKISIYKSKYKTLKKLEGVPSINRSFSTLNNVKLNNVKFDNINLNKEKILAIINSIKDTNNFRIALTHKSACLLDPKNETHESYERLEFFGDSLLEYYTTCFLFKSFPKSNEGNLSQLRTLLVESKNLAKISKNIGLDEYLNITVKIEKDEKIIKILADIYESFVGALYIEKGDIALHEFLSLTLFNRPETIKQLNNYKLNSLFVEGASNALVNSNYNLDYNLINSDSGSLNKLTFKFILDNKESIDNIVEQVNLLKSISYTLISSFQKSINQAKIQKEVIDQIHILLKNINIKNQLETELKNTNKIISELYNTNKVILELNSNISKIYKLLIDLRFDLFIIILIIIIVIIITKLLF